MPKHQHDPDLHCHHISPRGQRCRMLHAPNHDSLCANHLKQSAAAQSDTETLVAELLSDINHLVTADEINILLGNLVKQLAPWKESAKPTARLSPPRNWPTAMRKPKPTATLSRLPRHPTERPANLKTTGRSKQESRLPERLKRAPQNTATPAEPSIPRPPREYAGMRT